MHACQHPIVLVRVGSPIRSCWFWGWGALKVLQNGRFSFRTFPARAFPPACRRRRALAGQSWVWTRLDPGGACTRGERLGAGVCRARRRLHSRRARGRSRDLPPPVQAPRCPDVASGRLLRGAVAGGACTGHKDAEADPCRPSCAGARVGQRCPTDRGAALCRRVQAPRVGPCYRPPPWRGSTPIAWAATLVPRALSAVIATTAVADPGRTSRPWPTPPYGSETRPPVIA